MFVGLKHNLPALALALLFLLASPLALAESALRVLASVEPLRLLVQALGGERVEVQSLLLSGAEAHHASLRPSQLRQLADAELLVWVGPFFEAGLVRPLAQQRHAPRVLALGALAGDEQDPHFWLDPDRTLQAAQQVHAALVELRPKWRAELDRALRDFEADTAALSQSSAERLQPVIERGLLVSHDAYTHFVRRFGLRQLAALRDRHDRAPGARSSANFFGQAGSASCLVLDSEAARERLQPRMPKPGPAMVLLPPLGPNDRQFADYRQFLTWFVDALAQCLSGGQGTG